jgi:uncharacterized protein with HEPN domain
MDRDRSTLLDIVRAAELAIKFSAGMDKTSFLKDEKTQSAVLHQLMVMGEAVKRLSDDFRITKNDKDHQAVLIDVIVGKN